MQRTTFCIVERENEAKMRSIKDKFEYTKGVTSNRKPKNRQYSGQKKTDKQRSTRHYTEI